MHLQDGIENLQVTLSLLQEEADSEMQIEFENDLATMTSLLEKYRLEQLLDEPYDQNNAIIEIHPGAGGTESQDWGEMLLRMYTRWAAQHNFEVETADYEAGEEAGIKSVTLLVNGHNAYGYLRSEKGSIDLSEFHHLMLLGGDILRLLQLMSCQNWMTIQM